jgi:DnaJ domain
MAIKDYYAILMVHPQAELLVIEAAYKRLAREYHPDLGPSPRSHDKMVEINEAFAVLSNPTQRQSYDREYAQQFLDHQLAAQTTKVAPTPRKSSQSRPATTAKASDPLRENVCPSPPDPATFGIDAGYLKRAHKGAEAWQQREHRIPNRVKWLTRMTALGIGIMFCVVFFWFRWKPVAACAWLALPLLAELSMRAIERLRDAHLLRYKYNPLYNPNPAGYQAYAAANAKYEADTMIVYVTRDAMFHAQKSCQAMTSYDPMPKWFAQLRNAQPCRHCARALTVVPKSLPFPFGK